MKDLTIFFALIMNFSFLVAQTNEAEFETYFGTYHSLNELHNPDSSVMLDINEAGFSIFFGWDVIKDEENSGRDIYVVLPNYTGSIKRNSDSTAILISTSKKFSIKLDISDTLSLYSFNGTMEIFQDYSFVRFEGYFPKKYGNEIFNHNKIRWTYSVYALPGPSRMLSDDSFYYYNIQGDLIKTIKDTARIHPYSRLLFD